MSVWEKMGGIQGKVAAVLIAVFLAGGGTGYFAGRWQGLQEKIDRPSLRRAGFRERSRRKRGAFIHRLELDLGLQGEQKERVRAALSQHHDKMKSLRMEMRPQVENILQEARREIRFLLNSDQQSNFDQMIREFDDRRRRWRSRFMQKRMMERGGPMMGGQGRGRP